MLRVVEVDYESQAEPGQVHVLALGVGDYEARRLRYSEDDAEQISEVIHNRGLDAAGRQGIRRVLLGNEVSPESVERVFDEIARRVEDRPQDTVVVFLAGHTGVFDPQRFCLLLPTYPFPKDAPAQANEAPVQVKEAPILIAARGNATPNNAERQGRPQLRPALLGHRIRTCRGSRPSIA